MNASQPSSTDALPPVLRFRESDADGMHRRQEELIVDIERLVQTRLLIQAESGGGKSWMLRYLQEETYGRLPHIVFDLEGEFASLREQFPYVLVSATEGDGDLLARPEAAATLCRRLSELGAPAILDLYDLVVALRYAYSDKLPSQKQCTRMVRYLLLQTLSSLDGGTASVTFTGFREDAIKRLRTEEIHLSPALR